MTCARSGGSIPSPNLDILSTGGKCPNGEEDVTEDLLLLGA